MLQFGDRTEFRIQKKALDTNKSCEDFVRKKKIQETLPGWRDKFLSYKELKKIVRLISTAPTLLDDSLEFGKGEAEFVYLLNNEIDKFNAFFMEQEEDFIILHKELQQRIQRVVDKWGSHGRQPSETYYKEEMEKIRKGIVDFHGKMVLLVKLQQCQLHRIG
ncbi:SPX domain-containing protein [Quillaja saponaria]|uniref:SPX domain-containing protein n=1 Tax=Quillaja saponaria TaxID=32244 RepID=A0AAD7LPR6_QUISA|nr:SPX domain-containing protein [Quillaja saponaria]